MAIPPAAKLFFFRSHSDTLTVKLWHGERGLIVPGGANCPLCKEPETIEDAFLYCWDAIFLRDLLKRTLKKGLYITSYTVQFIPVEPYTVVPYDMVMVLELFSLWKSRMSVRHSEQPSKSVRLFFLLS